MSVGQGTCTDHSWAQALPIFLDRLLNPLAAILLSITVGLLLDHHLSGGGAGHRSITLPNFCVELRWAAVPQVVLIFGEIIPQSICTRYGLQVGAYSAYFVRVLMVLCAVIAWPISKLLDWVLGPEHEVNCGPPSSTGWLFSMYACEQGKPPKTAAEMHGETVRGF
jgi:CBS domain containing-hemolysin-like protein